MQGPACHPWLSPRAAPALGGMGRHSLGVWTRELRDTCLRLGFPQKQPLC